MLALWIAGRDARVPFAAKLLALAVAGYAFSPIDLIPDVIPVLGMLDDVILVPLGILMVIRMIGPVLMAEFRLRAATSAERPVSRIAAACFVVLWIAGAWLIWHLAAPRFLVH